MEVFAQTFQPLSSGLEVSFVGILAGAAPVAKQHGISVHGVENRTVSGADRFAISVGGHRSGDQNQVRGRNGRVFERFEGAVEERRFAGFGHASQSCKQGHTTSGPQCSHSGRAVMPPLTASEAQFAWKEHRSRRTE